MYDINEPKPERGGRTGVDVHRPEATRPGLTLVWSHTATEARLIDMDGTERHRWALEGGPRWHWCDLLEDGTLLVVANDSPYTPRRNGESRLLRLAPDGEPVWSEPAPAHHDARLLENGNVLAVCSAHAHHRRPQDRPMVHDFLQEITPDHEVVWEWHFARHDHEIEDGRAAHWPEGQADWPHINTVESLPPTPLGERDERFRPGNVLISPRHMHRILVIDRESERIVWDWGRGTILGQHQPTMLPDGHILLFDNGWGEPARGWSRAMEIEPPEGRIVWQWPAEPTEDFWSPVGSGVQRLPNGNTLICAMNWGEAGHVIEVTPAGEVVWDYWNPEELPFYRATRYAHDAPALRNAGIA